jgi:hypothetical protein
MSSYRTRKPVFQGVNFTRALLASDNNFGDFYLNEDCHGDGYWY